MKFTTEIVKQFPKCWELINTNHDGSKTHLEVLSCIPYIVIFLASIKADEVDSVVSIQIKRENINSLIAALIEARDDTE